MSEQLDIQSIKLYDMQGQIIRTFDSNERELDISGIRGGQYLLTVSTSEEKISAQVVVW
jgi:hypothetical protein